MKEQEVTVIPEPKPKKRIFGFKIVFILFLALVAALIAYSFLGEVFISGNIISSPRTFPFDAKLKDNFEKLEFSQNLNKVAIEFRGTSGKIYLGKENIIDLSRLRGSRLVLSNFDGDIEFDSNTLYLLSGKASKVSLNNVPSISTVGRIRVTLDRQIKYDKIHIDGVSIREFESNSKGELNINDEEARINLDGKKPLAILDFSGSLEAGKIFNFGASKRGILLEGSAERIVIGDYLRVG